MENTRLLYIDVEIDDKRFCYIGPEMKYRELKGKPHYYDKPFVGKMRKMRNKTFTVQNKAIVRGYYENNLRWEHHFGPEDTFSFNPNGEDGVFFKYTKNHKKQ